MSASAVAEAAPVCAASYGPAEYQSTLGPLLSRPSPMPPPAPPAPPARLSRATSQGWAKDSAREALGEQFTMMWVSNALQGWVIGVAPGPLDLVQARAEIVARLATYFSGDDLAYLTERLHVDAQPYRESELQATQAGVRADLAAGGVGPTSVGFGLCRLSDAIRVEVTLYQPVSAEMIQRAQALLVTYGDRVRMEVSQRGLPSPAIAFGPYPLLPKSPGRPPAAAISVLRYVSMPNSKPCVRGSRVTLAVRRPSRSPVITLSVRANGVRRTISATRLRRPLVVELTRRRTRIEVAVKLRDGTRGTRTTTLTRCLASSRSR